MILYKYLLADFGKTEVYAGVEELEKAGFIIEGVMLGNSRSWLEGVKYPVIKGYVGGMKENSETIRYESIELNSTYD